jgi:hypothetical protein
MQITQAVKKVANTFKYVKDRPIVISDWWSIMTTSNSGYLYGDCDDFAVTAIFEACDRNFYKFIWNVLVLHKYRIYYARTVNGERHAIGYGEGLYFDNWSREALPKDEFIRRTGHKIYTFFPGPVIAYFMLFGYFSRNDHKEK